MRCRERYKSRRLLRRAIERATCSPPAGLAGRVAVSFGNAGTVGSDSLEARDDGTPSFDAYYKCVEQIFREIVVRNLWVTWGSAVPPTTDQDFWAQARTRYGFVEAPYDNGGLPLGMRRDGATVTFDCMLCHAGRVAGKTLIGAPNSMVDLESFFDDLQRLRDLAPVLGIPVPPVPFDLDGLTSAVGAHDAFGLGFRVVGAGNLGLNTKFGPQRAPGWWLLHYKERIYVDGSAQASGHRSMMATLVAFGVTPISWRPRKIRSWTSPTTSAHSRPPAGI